MVNYCLNSTRRWLFPYRCLACAAPAEMRDLCKDCHHDLIPCRPACKCCALPLTEDGLLCGECQRQPPFFDRTIAAFHYQGIMAWLIQGLKFRGKLIHANLLSELLGAALVPHIESPPQLLLPVPLHRSRLRERGYNQAVELARPIAKKWSIPMRYPGQRIVATDNQSGLSRNQRRKNVKNAFHISLPPDITRVAIVDDVMTTGSTVNELARVLKQSGAVHVEVWVCARAVL